MILGLLIGGAVGLVGGGGAVLAVPVLVYIAGLTMHEAIPVSLAVVAAASATGAIAQVRRGTVCWSSAAWFAVSAVAGSAAGTALSAALPAALLLIVFALVMALAARSTWQRAGRPAAGEQGCPKARARVLVPVGLAVGALTGLIGVGGGFVVVPALAVGLSFGMREAIGTSMVIVTISSLAGLSAHLVAGSPFDTGLALTMGTAMVIGALAGAVVAPRVSTRRLGRGFAVLVASVAVLVLGLTAAGA